MTNLKVKNKILAKLRTFKKGMNVEEFLETEYRQVIRALQNQFISSDTIGEAIYRNRNIVKTQSCGNFTTTGTANVTNLTGQITTQGGDVEVRLQADGLFAGQLGCFSSSAASGATFYLSRNGADIASYQISANSTGATASTCIIPSSTFSFIDSGLEAGTYTYTLRAEAVIGTAVVRNSVLVIYEN